MKKSGNKKSDEIELTPNEKLFEFGALAMVIVVLIACFLKVLFF